MGDQVLEPHARRVDEGFSEARVLAEVSLLPDKIRVSSGRRAVALATGVVDRTYKPGKPQKQVLVVVTSGWSVMCFDHNLKKLWETNLQVCIKCNLRTIYFLFYKVYGWLPICSFLWFNQPYWFIWKGDFPHNAHHREVAISISNYTLKHGDAGLVIVGGRMEMQPHVCHSSILFHNKMPFSANLLLVLQIFVWVHVDWLFHFYLLFIFLKKYISG